MSISPAASPVLVASVCLASSGPWEGTSEGGAWGTVPRGPWPGMTPGPLLGQSARSRGVGPPWRGGTDLVCLAPARLPPRILTRHLPTSCLIAPLPPLLASLCLLVLPLLSCALLPELSGGPSPCSQSPAPTLLTRVWRTAVPYALLAPHPDSLQYPRRREGAILQAVRVLGGGGLL